MREQNLCDFQNVFDVTTKAIRFVYKTVCKSVKNLMFVFQYFKNKLSESKNIQPYITLDVISIILEKDITFILAVNFNLPTKALSDMITD